MEVWKQEAICGFLQLLFISLTSRGQLVSMCTQPEHTRINSTAKKFSHLRRAIIENHSADGNKGRRCGKYRFLQKHNLTAFRAEKESVCIVFQGQRLLLIINNVNN